MGGAGASEGRKIVRISFRDKFSKWQAPVIGMPIVSCTTRIGGATKSRVFADTQPKVVMNALAKQPFAALDLCERFGVKTTTARTGEFCLVAAALFGDPDVDLQYHCMKAISQKPAQK